MDPIDNVEFKISEEEEEIEEVDPDDLYIPEPKRITKDTKRKCQHCPFRTRNNETLQNHIKTEHPEMILKCHLCERSCGSAIGLHQHLIGTHKVERIVIQNINPFLLFKEVPAHLPNFLGRN